MYLSVEMFVHKNLEQDNGAEAGLGSVPRVTGLRGGPAGRAGEGHGGAATSHPHPPHTTDPTRSSQVTHTLQCTHVFIFFYDQ